MKRRIAYKVLRAPANYPRRTVDKALAVVRRDSAMGRKGAWGLTLRYGAWRASKLPAWCWGLDRGAPEPPSAVSAAFARVLRKLQDGLLEVPGPDFGVTFDEYKHYRRVAVNDPTPRPDTLIIDDPCSEGEAAMTAERRDALALWHRKHFATEGSTP